MKRSVQNRWWGLGMLAALLLLATRSRQRVLLGVTGSIACYKAADLASKLAQSGALVDVILTQSAQRFLTPLTFQSGSDPT